MGPAPFLLATAQLPITGDVRVNARHVLATMREAAAQDARLVHFPEGMLSGYAKNPIQDWTEVDWDSLREELELIMALAAELRLWVVLGSAHPLTPPHWPHNSLYVISDQGQIVTRYDCEDGAATSGPRLDPRYDGPLCLALDLSAGRPGVGRAAARPGGRVPIGALPHKAPSQS